MYELIHRLLVFLWFLSYMAVVYLALHMLAAKVSPTPDNRVLWFFSIITAPLTRPMRAVLPPGSPEGRVRLLTLVALVALWLGTRVLLGALGGVGSW